MADSIELAKQAFIHRDFKGAIANYDRALKDLPDDQLFVAYSNKGAALMNTGRTKEAIKCFRRALELNDEHYESMHNLGVAFAASQQYSKALECFDKTIERAPDFYASYCGKSEALASLNRFEEAAAAAKDGIRENREEPIAYADLGFAYLKMKRFESSVKAYEQAIKLKDRSPETSRLYALALSEYALSCQKKNDPKRALELYERALEKNETPLALHNLGVLYMKLKHASKARSCFSKALKRDPDFFEASAALGVLHARDASYDQALPFLRKAYDVDPTNTDNLYNLGIIYMKVGKRDDALRAFKVLRKLDPSNEDARVAFELLKGSANGSRSSSHSRVRSQSRGSQSRSSSSARRRSRRKFYTKQELQAHPAPDGVDPASREMYLDDQEFYETFDMSKDEFADLPDWRRDKLKKEHGLF
mmetsp:Transcript_21363/g.41872  ORF Transcript_21363/g.41872 Transcript_21363/m.41872 type:complete len:421 (-) Transcript_21363:65-1327(-)|eukprot:CAMPEP_0171511008 /NCGR_PEP_ID=MMETSP0959-20130129/730_1 /TAXON_ID=87120 /ORGANISM="Aurantiochytrium limacinum, Strain ATCCMYA-1381" /LENGTH=420 /DNA_ID=CAMNT_0012048535 /DNA_START=481 /DNA_END=1743 /DNA_ORIENTATION=+